MPGSCGPASQINEWLTAAKTPTATSPTASKDSSLANRSLPRALHTSASRQIQRPRPSLVSNRPSHLLAVNPPWPLMARPQNRKRQRADDPSQEHPPTKKIKSRRGIQSTSNFSPQFWDDLSRVWLTPRALRELDRRNRIQPPSEPEVHAGDCPTDLARFARHGGPDLHHIRTVIPYCCPFHA